jgi:hypothetical protein
VNTEAGNTAFRESFADDLDSVPNTKEVKAVGYCMKKATPFTKNWQRNMG